MREWPPPSSTPSASISSWQPTSQQHGALPAAVGAAAVQCRHVRFSHDAVADSTPQIFYFNYFVISFIHQDSVLLQMEGKGEKKQLVMRIVLVSMSMNKVGKVRAHRAARGLAWSQQYSFIYLFLYSFIYLFLYLFIYFSIYLFIYFKKLTPPNGPHFPSVSTRPYSLKY